MDILYSNGHIPADNGSSGKVSFEANTNPLYEFTNTDNIMESDSSNPLYELNSEPTQKEVKSEPSNLLYEYMQNEGQSNGHAEEGLTNGAGNEVDLLGGSGDLLGGETDLLGGSGDVSGGGVDLLGDGYSQNLMDDKTDLLGESEPADDKQDLLVDSEPAVVEEPAVKEETEPEEIEPEETEPIDQVQDTVDKEEGEATQARSRSSSENSEPEQENGESVQNNGPISDIVEVSNEDVVDQCSGPVEDDKPKENDEDVKDEVVENVDEVLDEGTIEEKTEVEEREQPVEESAAEQNSSEVLDEGTNEADQDNSEVKVDTIAEKEEVVSDVKGESDEMKQEGAVSELVAETDEQFDDADAVADSETTEVEPEIAPVDADVEEEIAEVKKEETIENEPVLEQEVLTVPDPVAESASTCDESQQPTESPEAVNERDAVPAETSLEVETVEAENVTPAENTIEDATEVPEVVEETEVAEQVAEEEALSEQIDTEAKEGSIEDKAPETQDLGDEDTAAVTKETEQVVETRNSNPDENALKVNGASEISENGISEEDAVRDPDIFRETHQKEEIHFAEMNNVRQKFESGQTSSEEQTPKRVSVKEEYDQGGEFENEPVRNPDVVREADQPSEELPEIGMAKNLVSRFKTISEEKSKPGQARPASPPRTADKVEYESQPTEHLPQYEAKVESGVFESEPKGHEDVVRSGDHTEDYKPEQGSAKNILNRFKEIETESGKVKSSQKRELTPDKSGKVEYVSEPRGESIQYNESKSECGVFENVPTSEEDVVKSGDRTSEVLPEAGFAKSVLSKFKQMESEVGNKPPPSPKRDIVGDKSGKSEFVSEPRGFLEKYEPQTESGEYENQPAERGEVVRSGEAREEVLPETGSAKKTMERFKEIQKQSSSPVSSSRSKAMTPPREVSPGRAVAGVSENQPVSREDVVRSGEAVPELLPEQGSTRNMLNKFKEIQTSGSQSSSPGRKPKEFTPPPESGVYENTPKEHLVVETRQSESGVLENTPSKSVADVARQREATPEAEMPEQGYAKNMVSKWKQLESSSGSAKSTSSTSPRFKQFTPPRDNKGPLSPKSPIGVTNGVHPSELPGQYQPQESSVIVENNPEVMEGIYREADTDWTAGMPAPNTTSSMLQKFKQIQSKAKDDETSQAPVTKKEKGMFKVVQSEKCAACQKTVYAMEKLEMNGHIYHKNCFKCSHCSARLTPKTFSMNEGVIYCVNHFKQLFARKGNYDEGFGRQQYKKKWGGEKKEGATP